MNAPARTNPYGGSRWIYVIKTISFTHSIQIHPSIQANRILRKPAARPGVVPTHTEVRQPRYRRKLASLEAITESGERRIGGLPGEDVALGVVRPAGDDVRPFRKPPHRTLHVRQRGVGLRADLHGEKAVNPLAPDVGTEDIPI